MQVPGWLPINSQANPISLSSDEGSAESPRQEGPGTGDAVVLGSPCPMKQAVSQATTGNLLRAQQVLARLNISRATLYRGIKAGRLPKPVFVSAHAVRWRSTDIDILVERGVQII
jgi:predicted DNA-binding transcriptional regulator AlpA